MVEAAGKEADFLSYSSRSSLPCLEQLALVGESLRHVLHQLWAATSAFSTFATLFIAKWNKV